MRDGSDTPYARWLRTIASPIQRVLPQHQTAQWPLCLLSIVRPQTKYHPLLASATRLTPVSSSSHGRRAKRKRVHRGGECIHSSGSTTHAVFDHRGGCCTADSVTCHRRRRAMDVQIPVHWQEDSGAQQAATVSRSMRGLSVKSPHRTESCAEKNKPTMDNEQNYRPGWDSGDYMQTSWCLRWPVGKTFPLSVC